MARRRTFTEHLLCVRGCARGMRYAISSNPPGDSLRSLLLFVLGKQRLREFVFFPKPHSQKSWPSNPTWVCFIQGPFKETPRGSTGAALSPSVSMWLVWLSSPGACLAHFRLSTWLVGASFVHSLLLIVAVPLVPPVGACRLESQAATHSGTAPSGRWSRGFCPSCTRLPALPGDLAHARPVHLACLEVAGLDSP